MNTTENNIEQQRDFNRMFFNPDHNEYTCPRCGSKDIQIKMCTFENLYLCSKCGHEARNIEIIPDYMIKD